MEMGCPFWSRPCPLPAQPAAPASSISAAQDPYRSICMRELTVDVSPTVIVSRSKYPVLGPGFRYVAERFNLCGWRIRQGFQCGAPQKSGGCDLVRLLAGVALLPLGLLIGSPHCVGADVWGGSAAVTSGHIRRGLSRRHALAPLQPDRDSLSNAGV